MIAVAVVVVVVVVVVVFVFFLVKCRRSGLILPEGSPETRVTRGRKGRGRRGMEA